LITKKEGEIEENCFKKKPTGKSKKKKNREFESPLLEFKVILFFGTHRSRLTVVVVLRG